MEHTEDNTVGRLRELAWFAGIVDGESCIGIYRTAGGLATKFTITNTSESLLKKAKEVVNSLGVRCIISNEPLRDIHHHLQAKTLQVGKVSSVLTLLEVVYPLLTSKKEQARTMMDFYKKYPPWSKKPSVEVDEVIAKLKLLKRSNS